MLFGIVVASFSDAACGEEKARKEIAERFRLILARM
jgi:hypothetical protein